MINGVRARLRDTMISREISARIERIENEIGYKSVAGAGVEGGSASAFIIRNIISYTVEAIFLSG